VSAEIWEYLGFPNVTNETWADYHVQCLNPSADFGSSGEDPQRLSDWAETVRAIKRVNPKSVVLMTYHTTEVWFKDLIRNNSGQQYLPLDCIMRNADGTPCDWWVPWPNGIITTNMFMPKCLAAVTTYAQRSLPALVAAGLDGVFLDGLVPFSEGCKPQQVDINCSSPSCHGTPTNATDAIGGAWWASFGAWFAALKEVHPTLLWINNGPYPAVAGGIGPSPGADPGEHAGAGSDYMLAHSNGRMIEGATGGALEAFESRIPISAVRDAVEVWTKRARQPSYVNVHMSLAGVVAPGALHTGLWVNAVNGGRVRRTFVSCCCVATV
jgi:hypothetical protein